MKKVILLIALALACASCGGPDASQYSADTISVPQKVGPQVEKVVVEGHDYLRFYSNVYGGGKDIEVLHSASCPATHEPGRVY